MATVHKEVVAQARPEAVWDAVRDVGAVHERLGPGFVTDTRLEDGARVVTFSDGMVAREVIVDIDDESRRLAYAIAPNGQIAHYSASMQVFPEGDAASRIVWIIDVLPDAIAAYVDGRTDLALPIMQATLERANASEYVARA